MLFIEYEADGIVLKTATRFDDITIALLITQLHITIKLQLAMSKGIGIWLLRQEALNDDRIEPLFLLLLEGFEQRRRLLPTCAARIGDLHQLLLAVSQRASDNGIFLRASGKQSIELLQRARWEWGRWLRRRLGRTRNHRSRSWRIGGRGMTTACLRLLCLRGLACWTRRYRRIWSPVGRLICLLLRLALNVTRQVTPTTGTVSGPLLIKTSTVWTAHTLISLSHVSQNIFCLTISQRSRSASIKWHIHFFSAL